MDRQYPMAGERAGERLGPLRGVLIRGLAWNAGYQVLSSAVQFGAMLIVVRIIRPEEYGHWAVALGILQFLNAAGIASALSHALQLPAGEEPDWTLHWHAGNLVQFGLFVVCNGSAILLAGWRDYAAVSPLLHIASIGLLFNTPAQMRMVMLQRRLDFRRLRTITAISSLLSVGVIVAGAMAGYGASALVLGGNVVVSLPAILDLMVLERWRPQGSWLAWPNFGRYRASLLFGAARVGGSMLAASRGALTAALLPSTLGFEAIGLINRAEGLFSMSVGRVVGLLSETAYPVLPQVAGDSPRFARIARSYSLLLLTLALAGLGLFAACGPDLSRVLYGAKWAAADPLLLPGAAVGLAAALGTVSGQLFLANGRLKGFLTLDLLTRIFMLPAFVGTAIFRWGMVTFSWTLAVPLVLAGIVSLLRATSFLPPGALRGMLPGPALAAAVACGATVASGWAMPQASSMLRAGTGMLVFSLSWYLVLRAVFPSTLGELLDLTPGWAKRRPPQAEPAGKEHS